MDLFDNPVGYLTSLRKMRSILLFLAVVVQKLKFLNNSNTIRKLDGLSLTCCFLLDNSLKKRMVIDKIHKGGYNRLVR
jgi:hypothetical protein